MFLLQPIAVLCMYKQTSTTTKKIKNDIHDDFKDYVKAIDEYNIIGKINNECTL